MPQFKIGDVYSSGNTNYTLVGKTSDGELVFEYEDHEIEYEFDKNGRKSSSKVSWIAVVKLKSPPDEWQKKKKSLGWINVWKTSRGFMCSSKPHATKANAEESRANWTNLAGVSCISCVEIFEE